MAFGYDKVSIIGTAVVTVGIFWLFYPAWVVLIAESLEWKVEWLSLPDKQCDEIPVLSLVIPAYNEQDRIPTMICEAFNFLRSSRGKKLLRRLQACGISMVSSVCEHGRSGMLSSDESIELKAPDPKVEWLVVNDGSIDFTCEVVREIYNKLTNINCINGDNTLLACSTSSWKWRTVSLEKNCGKGAAVKVGMNLASGMFHLMVDADGATDFEQGMENLIREMEGRMERISNIAGKNGDNRTIDSLTAVFGSRAHLEKHSTAQRSVVRTLLMKAFHFFVSFFVSANVHDTQCGFKLFTKSASNLVFNELHLRRWAFDTEIVLICEKEGIEISEVAVPWKEIDGSKLSTSKLALAIVSVSMLRDMMCVRACYTLGIWKTRKRYQ